MTLVVRDLVRRYSRDVHVGPLSFTVADGEFFALLGPSGCGKTTTLRCIAGFERVDSGQIMLAERDIAHTKPHRRGVGLVFQSHALFPHLTVAQNVAFGLEVHKVPKAQIGGRVQAALDLVALQNHADRMPAQLSGGQQQRVALARALVMEPPLLLLDEPMSSLDLKLRLQMREELRQLQRRLRMTTIFVTHDQTEALALSDRIAVLSQGHIEQIGTPEEIYRRPATRFVAEFIGSSNLLDGNVADDGAPTLITPDNLSFKLAATARRGPCTALVRPECVQMMPEGTIMDGPNLFAATVSNAVYLGEDAQFDLVVAGGTRLRATCKSTGRMPGPGAAVTVRIAPRDLFVLPA
jgi:ABC-type Fe3+/spermidine/putrescine transport system ATPase subunit